MATILNNKETVKRYENLIKQCKAEKLFKTDNHSLTPNRHVRRIIKKIGKRKNILVINSIEFALELLIQERKDVTITTKKYCQMTKYFADKFGYNYYTMEELKGMGKKFSAGVTNPPYKQGLFRDIMIDLLENIIEDNGVLAQISPDETLPTNNKNHKTLPAMKKYGLQEIEDASIHFPNVTTSAPIVTYYFDKSKKYNPSVFDKELSEADKLTLSIIKKIKYKQPLGTLTQSAAGTLDNESTEMVNALVQVTKQGPVYEMMPRNKIRYVSDGENYIFTNRFIGINKEDTVVKVNGPLYIIKEKVYAIGNTSMLGADDFVNLYLHPVMRFCLKFYRGNNTSTLGTHIRQLPVMMPNTDVENYFEITPREMEHINNELG